MTPAQSDESNAGGTWATYQEDVADFFRGLGASATVDARLHGVRTVHDVERRGAVQATRVAHPMGSRVQALANTGHEAARSRPPDDRVRRGC